LNDLELLVKRERKREELTLNVLKRLRVSETTVSPGSDGTNNNVSNRSNVTQVHQEVDSIHARVTCKKKNIWGLRRRRNQGKRRREGEGEERRRRRREQKEENRGGKGSCLCAWPFFLEQCRSKNRGRSKERR
jgi:hypothetical protein